MKRRELLRRLAAAAAAPAAAPAAFEQAADPAVAWPDGGGRAFLVALAEVALPSEIGARGREEIVDAFARWLRMYSEGAEMDHGYGFTNLRRTGRSPARQYPDHMASLNQEATRRAGASFASASADVRRSILEDALRSGKAERLQAAPTGNVIVDLMGFYFRTSGANDLCYRAAIGRDACRGLPGSESPPSTLLNSGF